MHYFANQKKRPVQNRSLCKILVLLLKAIDIRKVFHWRTFLFTSLLFICDKNKFLSQHYIFEDLVYYFCSYILISTLLLYYIYNILAFMCHHNTFLLYCSIEDTSLGKWNKVTHASIFISFVMMVLMAFGGYATFTQNVQGILCTHSVIVP